MISQIRIKKARNANLCEYLIGNGCTLVKEGRQFRVKGTPGLVVMDNYWYDHAQQRGGNAIDYVIQIEGAKFKDAVAVLEEYCDGTSNCNPSPEDRRDHSRHLKILRNKRSTWFRAFFVRKTSK